MLYQYKPMLVLLLLCGYDFKFYNCGVFLKIATKVYCIILIILVSYATMTCCKEDEISQLWSLLEYVTSVVILILCKGGIVTFFQKLHRIDSNLRIYRNHYLHIKRNMVIYTIFVWALRVVYTGVYCMFFSCYVNFTLYLLTQLSLLSLDINRVWRFMLFDMIRYRLRILRLRLEEMPDCNSYFHVQNKKSIKENKFRFCLGVYKKIADVVELISTELSASVSSRIYFAKTLCLIFKFMFYNRDLLYFSAICECSLQFSEINYQCVSCAASYRKACTFI